MNAFNPIATMRRLEGQGFQRKQAEALADELASVRNDLVTRADLEAVLDAKLNSFTLRICAAMGVMMALGFTVLAYVATLPR